MSKLIMWIMIEGRWLYHTETAFLCDINKAIRYHKADTWYRITKPDGLVVFEGGKEQLKRWLNGKRT